MSDREDHAPDTAPDPGNSPPEDWSEPQSRAEEEFARQRVTTNPVRFDNDDEHEFQGGDR